MIIFTKQYIQNFFRIKEEQVIDLNNQGLVLIIGENSDSPTSSSNGAGKSTIFEALVWCLWGKTVRGYKSDQVINTSVGKNCYVRQEFLCDNKSYSIIRYRKHKEFKNQLHLYSDYKNISGQTDKTTQELIDELLGIDYETFIRGPMMPQGSFKRFSEMTDAESKKILDQTVKTNVFSQAQDLVKEWLRVTNNTILDDSDNLNSVHNFIEDIEDEIIELKEKESGFSRQLDVKATKKRIKISDLNASIDFDENQIIPVKHMNLQIKESERALEEHNDDIADLNLEGLNVEKEKEKYQNLNSKYIISCNNVRTLKSECDSIENLEYGVRCGVCYQEITKNHQEVCFSEAYDRFCEVEEKNGKLKKKRDKQKIKYLKLKEDYDSKVEDYYKNSELLKENVSALKSTKSFQIQTVKEVKWYKEQVIELWKEINEIREEVSPYQIMIEKKERKLKKEEKKLRKYIASIALSNSRKKYYDFWLNGFSNKGLKNMVLNSVTPFLNKRVAYYSKILTNNELDIVFETQKILKSGDVRDSFSVSVTNKNGATDYIGNSGGEKSKADFAINFAMSDLVSARSQKAFPQRFFDEPFDGLDELGLEAAIELLTKMAEQAGSIFVITHNSELKSLFNNVITVRKKNGTSRII